MARVIVVDDETKLTEVLKDFLTLRGFQVWTASKGEEALPLIQTQQPEVLLLDLNLDGSHVSGLDVLRKTKEVSPKTTVIVISAETGADTKAEVLHLGAARYLDKPLDLEQLIQIIQELTAIAPS